MSALARPSWLLPATCALAVVATGAGTLAQGLLPPERPRDAPSALVAKDPSLPRSAAASFAFGPYTSTQVNVDGAGLNIVGDAANEPSLTVSPADPDVIVVGWRQFDSISSDFREAGWSYSHDGGASWTFPGVLEDGVFRSDPSLDAASDGTLYYQSLYLDLAGDIFNDVWTSTDGGVSWNGPAAAFGGDKNWLAVDRSGGPGDGHLYGTWQPFFDCCAGATLTRSVDGGASFQTPVQIAGRPLFGTLTVGGDGVLFMSGMEGVFFQDLDTFVLARSANAQDAGASPSSTAVAVDMGGGMTVGEGPNPSGLLGQVNVAVDASGGAFDGRVYVLATVDPSGGGGPGPTEVRVAASSDGGASFAPSVRVHDDPLGNGAWHWLAAADVAPDGRLDVVWYDTRNSGQENVSQLFYTWSYDGGQSFAPNVAVTPAFDSWLGWPQQAKMGDYIGVRSALGGADVAYTATFNGEQDVYHVRVFPLGVIVDLGLGLAGGAGVPVLNGSGSLANGSPVSLALSGALASTPAGLFLGVSRVDAPFKGGVLVPAPDIVLTGFTTDGAGALTINATWPAGLPSGLSLYAQMWMQDAGGPKGLSASNGLQLITP